MGAGSAQKAPEPFCAGRIAAGLAEEAAAAPGATGPVPGWCRGSQGGPRGVPGGCQGGAGGSSRRLSRGRLHSPPRGPRAAAELRAPAWRLYNPGAVLTAKTGAFPPACVCCRCRIGPQPQLSLFGVGVSLTPPRAGPARKMSAPGSSISPAARARGRDTRQPRHAGRAAGTRL